MTAKPSPRALPPELATILPFAEFLEDLRARGFPIGFHDYRDVALLLARWPGADVTELRNAMAALLARTPADIQDIRRMFEEWVASTPPADATAERPQIRNVRLRRFRPLLIALATVAIVLSLVAAAVLDQKDKVKKSMADATTTTATATHTQDEPMPPSAPPPAQPPSYFIPIVVALFGTAVTLVFAMMLRTEERRSRWIRRYWRDVLGRMPGPHQYALAVKETAPIAQDDINQMAAIVGRAREMEPTSGALDVNETLRLTLRAGLRPVLAFEPPPRNVPVLALQDVGAHMRPWTRHVEQLASGLARQGVQVERWYFDGNLATAMREPHGKRVPLDVVAALRSDHSLLVLSTGDGIWDESLPSVARALETWTYRTWINPIRQPDYWRPSLANVPIRVWPLTPAGLRGAAIEISRTQDLDLVPREAALRRRVTAADVERVKRLIAVVPYPTVELAAELRRRFCPDVPEEVLLFIAAQGVFYGESIRLPSAEIERLLRSSSEEETLRQHEVRRYLLEVLRDSQPPVGSSAHLRWQLDRAIHELSVGDAASAAAQLHDLSAGPLREEVRSRVEQFASCSDAQLTVGHDVLSSQPKLPSRIDMTADVNGRVPRVPIWSLPKRSHVIAALAAGAAILGGWALAGAPMGKVIPHVLNAYSLEVRQDAKRTILNASRGHVPGSELKRSGMPLDDKELEYGGLAPAKAELYRSLNGRWVKRSDTGFPADIVLRADETGAHYQLRARLPAGNLALSNVQWVPGPVEPPQTATLTVRIVDQNGVPSAMRFEAIASNGARAAGSAETPIVLAPGEYGLEILIPRGRPWRVPDPVVLHSREDRLLTVILPSTESAYGRLLITSVPRGVTYRNLIIASLDVPSTPPQPVTSKETTLRPGKYQVVLRNEFYDWSTPATIVARGVTAIAVNPPLPSEGIVRVLGVPVGAALAVQQFPGRADERNGVWTLRGAPGRYIVPILRAGANIGQAVFTIVAGQRIDVMAQATLPAIGPAAQISIEFFDVADAASLLLDGEQIDSWKATDRHSRRIELKPGEHTLEIRILKSAVRSMASSVAPNPPGGWHYSAAIRSGEVIVWEHSEVEDFPPTERLGRWFTVAILHLVATEQGEVKLRDANTDVWRSRPQKK